MLAGAYLAGALTVAILAWRFIASIPTTEINVEKIKAKQKRTEGSDIDLTTTVEAVINNEKKPGVIQGIINKRREKKFKKQKQKALKNK